MSNPTSRKPNRANTEHARVNARAADLKQEFDRLQDQIRRLRTLASLGTTAASLAHEINNLMTPVLGYARFALKENDADLMTKALRTTVDQIEAAVAMTDRILSLAADRPVAIEAVGLRQVVQDAVLATCRDLLKDGVAMTIEIDESLRVRGDARRLQQVFFNLIQNARDALAGRSGRIVVRAEPGVGDSVAITFADTGAGIAPEIIDRIFDPFVTTKTSPPARRGGTGLGLNICRDIVREHGGDISVESRLDHGTTFFITLPRATNPSA